MWHHILPSWLVALLYGLALMTSTEVAGNALFVKICACTLIGVAGLALYLSKHTSKLSSFSSDTFNLVVSGLFLVSGVLLLAACCYTVNNILLIAGIAQVVFSSIYFVIACIIRKFK